MPTRPTTPRLRQLARCGLAVGLGLAMQMPAQAQTVVQDAWIRATTLQQKATGAFMQLMSTPGARLVGAESPIAEIVEIHQMSLDNGVMKMRAVEAIELPPGKPIALTPGGYHLMLMDLRQPLQAGDKVPLTLLVDDLEGKRETIRLDVSVRAMGGQ